MAQIVFNIPVFDLVIVPADFFKDRDGIEQKRKDLAAAIEISDADFAQRVKDAEPTSYESFIVLEDIEKEKALIIDERIKGMAGVKLEDSAIRKYTDGQYFSSIIGYSGRINQKELEKNPDYLLTDVIGKDGLEYTYEGDLRGTYGISEVEVDSLGKVNRSMQKACSGSRGIIWCSISMPSYRNVFIKTWKRWLLRMKEVPEDRWWQ